MLEITSLILFGLILLFIGGQALVTHGAKLAELLGVPPLIIGLTVVAYGTSSPEMMVNVIASSHGKVDIAIGNIIGSNIFNIFFILGLSAFLHPLIIHLQIIKFDIPIMIGAALLTWLFGWLTGLNYFVGLFFTLCIFIYTYLLIRIAKKEPLPETPRPPFTYKALLIHCAWILLALFLLVLGSRWLVEGTIALATSLGISELIISLTIVAAGTSLPELTTSLIATWKKEYDIAVGNIIGSNIFNVFAILGVSALIHPLPVPLSTLTYDIPIMILASLACLPLMIKGRMGRLAGLLLLISYFAYLTGLYFQTVPS